MLALGAMATPVDPKPTVLAPGYRELAFTPPPPGSYRLPPLGQAGDGQVLTSTGKPLRLHELMGDKVVLLSFIYLSCSDLNGCPLAVTVYRKIMNRLKKEPAIADQVRLLTLSFNPLRDTPAHIADYRRSLVASDFDWQFLTTASESDLEPILARYRQNIQKVYDDQGHFTGTFSHLLRVYLIDHDKQLRNIYSVAFLHADTLVNDIKTLLNSVPHAAGQAALPASDSLYRPGDDKQGYDRAGYVTQSVALTDRTGKSIDLLQTALQPPLGLPALPVPEDNPLTEAKIQLGRRLFYDRRLSFNNTVSCAICHIPEQGFSSNEMKTAIGIEGRSGMRNSPTLYNVGYMRALFHDGRESTLEQQIWGPLLEANEMGNPSVGWLINKLKTTDDYRRQFLEVFGREPSMETLGKAIASYERTLVSAASDFDRWYFGKDPEALSAAAKRGFELFRGKAGCAHCHRIGDNDALLTDQGFHNTGIGYAAAMGGKDSNLELQIAPGVQIAVAAGVLESLAEPASRDLGRYAVTQDPEDLWKFKTPGLRNIALTAPYMHNGVFSTLREVVEFYNQGGIDNDHLDPLIKPLNLSAAESADITAFLEALTGRNVSELVGDAFAAPVGDVH